MTADGAGRADARRVAEPRIALRKEDFQIFGGQPYQDYAKVGFRPRADLPPVPLAPPLDWSADPLSDNNWCFQLHGWRMLQPIWTEFSDKDPQALVAAVMPWIRDWHAFHVRDQRESLYAWHDMASGLRAQHLALLLHMEQQGAIAMEQEDRAIVEGLARLHVARFREQEFISPLNHGIFQVVGLRLLGIVGHDWPECENEEAYSTSLIERLVASQFNACGVHVDNSPFYHDYILKVLRRIRPALFPGLGEVLSDRLAKAAEISPWLSLPDGKLATIGDTEGVGAGFKLPRAMRSDLITAAGTPIVVKDLSEGGYVVVRSAPEVPASHASMLIVNGTAFSKTHAHADHLGFELFHQGRKLFVDSGKYTYNYDRWRDYFLSDRAHNVVGLKGKSFAPADTTTSGSALHACERVDDDVEIRGEVVRRGYFRHQRRLVYRPESSLVLYDRIRARPWDAPVSYLHLAHDLDAAIEEDGVHVLAGGSIVARVRSDPACRPRLVKGEEHPLVQGWVSESYRTKQPAWVLEFRHPRGRKTFITSIELHASHSPQRELFA